MEDKLNIAILSLHTCPFERPGSRYTGGMNVYIQNLAGELARRGHSVDIFTCSHADDDYCTLIDESENVRLVHIETPALTKLPNELLGAQIESLSEAICSYCLEHGRHYDLVHSHYWISGAVGSSIKKNWCMPHVTMFHTLGAVKNSLGLGQLETEFRISTERAVVSSADLIIASTEREKNELIARYAADPAALAVVPCGIDPSLFRPMDRELARKLSGLPSKKTALFVGRLDPLKALGNLLEAVSHLKSRDDFQLVLVGGNEHGVDFQALMDAVGDHDIHHIVNLVGSVPHERMRLYYNAADFCVVPSHYESFSLVILESLACGTPVLATDVGEARHIAGLCPACRIISRNSPDELSSNINEMLDAPSRSNGLAELAALYGWDSVVDRILEKYRRVIAANSEYTRQLCSFKP